MTKKVDNAFAGAVSILLVSGLAASVVVAQSGDQEAHLAIENPAELPKDEASRIYESLMDRMAMGYEASRLDILANYQDWPVFNDAPFVSATHGQRYVNSYANVAAHNYGTLQEGEKLPAGSVLAKDSMTVTTENRIFPGALFVMEKLPQGTSPATGDWRYIMVMPDGSLFGDTMGDRSAAVAYCHECHISVEERDFTFFVPEEYQVGNQP